VTNNLGRDAPYAERLLFEMPQGGTEDLDEGHVSGAVLQQAVGKLKDAVTAGRKPPTVAPQLTRADALDALLSREAAKLWNVIPLDE
jgi:hypothetical protein